MHIPKEYYVNKDAWIPFEIDLFLKGKSYMIIEILHFSILSITTTTMFCFKPCCWF